MTSCPGLNVIRLLFSLMILKKVCLDSDLKNRCRFNWERVTSKSLLRECFHSKSKVALSMRASCAETE